MKVHKLIDLLQDCDPELEVHISYNSGDHWRTQLAPAVRRMDELPVVHSDYHSMDKLTDDEDESGKMVAVLFGH